MKHFIGLLMMTALAGSGCVGMEKIGWERDVSPPKQQAKEKPPTAPVTKDGVTEATAAQSAAALAAELDRAAAEPAGQPK